MMSPATSCATCESLLAPDQTHCVCGRPTALASFADRAAYEVAQWQAYKGSVAAADA
jgi:hypothetical protein